MIACDDAKAAICALSYYLEYLEWGKPPDETEAVKRRMGPRCWDDKRVYEKALQLITDGGKRGMGVDALDANRASIIEVRAVQSERGKRSAAKKKQMSFGKSWAERNPGKLPPYAGEEGAWPDEPGEGTGEVNSAVQQDCYKNDRNGGESTAVFNSTVEQNCRTAVSQSGARAFAPAPSPLAVSASQGANALVASSDGSGVGGPPSSATHVLRHEDRRITTHCPECWNTCHDWLMEKSGQVPYCGNCGVDHVEGAKPAGMHQGAKIALKAQDAMQRELARLRANVSNIVAVPAAAAAEPLPMRALPTTEKAASMLKARVKTVTVKTRAKLAAKVKIRTA